MRRALAALLALAAAPALAGAPGASYAHAQGDGDAAPAPLPPPAREPSMHTVFSAECTPYFDWQSLALVRSHKLVGMPGPITRLLACDDEALRNYKYKDIVPTHVHPNFNTLHMADIGDNYVPYNKPGSIKHWLEHVNVTEEYVFFIDADMLFLRPVTPSLVGATPGHAVSAAYDYLVGVDDPSVVERFLPEPYRPLMRKVGGWTMMLADDMRRVAPLWLSYTEAVRTAPFGREVWHKMGDAYVTEEHPRPWISEMYGYVFGAAHAGVDHTVNREMMLYPTYAPDGEPYILHYGLEIAIGPSYKFDKHFHTAADRLACPVRLFDTPPRVDDVIAASWPDAAAMPPREPERVRLAVFTIDSLNAALKEFSDAGGRCPLCPPGCADEEEACSGWAASGECDKNPSFMQSKCKLTCAVCACAPGGANGTRGVGSGGTVLLRGGAVARRRAGDGGGAEGGGAGVADASPPPPRRAPAELHAANAVRDAAARASAAAAARTRPQEAQAEAAEEEDSDADVTPPPPPKRKAKSKAARAKAAKARPARAAAGADADAARTGGGEEAFLSQRPARRSAAGGGGAKSGAPTTQGGSGSGSSGGLSPAGSVPVLLAALAAAALLAWRELRRRARTSRRKRAAAAAERAAEAGGAPAGSRYDD